MSDGTADGRRILITGIAGALAGQLALRLEAEERVAYIGGVDLAQPSHALNRTEFVRADLRHPLVAKVIDSTKVDTIVHMAITPRPRGAGGRSRMKELNVIGTMQLLGAAQKAPRLRKLVLRSTTAVYGSHHRDPALFREDMRPRLVPRHGYTRDMLDVESTARSFSRRRQDVATTTLRFANLIGPDVTTTMTDYLSLPVIPTVLGYDPRLQLLHSSDAVEVLFRATIGDHAGIYNVAGPGIVYLSQAARMLGRPTLPIPRALVDPLAGTMRALRRLDFTTEQLPLLQFGRVGDISRMREAFDYEPRFSTVEALRDFLRAGRVEPLFDADRIAGIEARLERLVSSAAAVAQRSGS